MAEKKVIYRCPKCGDGNSQLIIPGTINAVATYDTFHNEIMHVEHYGCFEFSSVKDITCSGCGAKFNRFELVEKESEVQSPKSEGEDSRKGAEPQE